jgi:hypothetical protein
MRGDRQHQAQMARLEIHDVAPLAGAEAPAYVLQG